MSEMAADLTTLSVPRKSERIASRAVDGKAVLVVLDARKLHTLNHVGTRVFELCDGSRDVAAIARQIAAEFEVDAARAEHDALTFLQQLIAEGAVELVARGAR
jgi:hypothetical protein